jgi:membrane protein involved in colicin uptake
MPADAQDQHAKDSAAIASTVVGAADKPPSLEDIDESATATQEADGDGGEAAMLFGRYMGQIKARIERAWEYAGSPSRRRSQCRVQIRQSAKGDVQDIAVQRCELDPEGQLSLVRAIQAASPLSAPPSEKVFTEVVTLTFTAAPQIANSVDSSSSDARHATRLN